MGKQSNCILCGKEGLGCVPKGHIQVPLCCVECSLDCESWVLQRINSRYSLQRPIIEPIANCATCKKPFRKRNGSHKFCSLICKQISRHEYDKARNRKRYTIVECRVCGKSFVKNRSAKTCSDECSLTWARQYGAAQERKRRAKMIKRKVIPNLTN